MLLPLSFSPKCGSAFNGILGEKLISALLILPHFHHSLQISCTLLDFRPNRDNLPRFILARMCNRVSCDSKNPRIHRNFKIYVWSYEDDYLVGILKKWERQCSRALPLSLFFFQSNLKSIVQSVIPLRLPCCTAERGSCCKDTSAHGAGVRANRADFWVLRDLYADGQR